MSKEQSGSWLSPANIVDTSYEIAKNMRYSDLDELRKTDWEYADYLAENYGSVIGLNEVMHTFGFETIEQAQAFIAEGSAMAEEQAQMSDLMFWGGFTTDEEAEAFLTDLEAQDELR